LRGRLNNLWLEVVSLAGLPRVVEWRHRDVGVILRFERVRPRRSDAFQPLLSREVSPQDLDRFVRALKRWNYDVISIEQLSRRLQHPPDRARQFVCITFDIGYRDFRDHAWPILKSHGVPVALYLPANFPDQLGELWWLALEEVVATQDRIGLIVNGVEQRLDCRSVREKNVIFDHLFQAVRAMAPSDGLNLVRDLCRRYSVDLHAVSSAAVMTWSDVVAIASNPLLTIGSATVTYPMLSHIDRQSSERELRMGRAVLEAALGRRVSHLAYPYGDRDSFGRREVLVATEVGFATAVTTQPGVVNVKDPTDAMTLPRISWDGRSRSLRVFRAMLAGFGVPGVT
jgi:peptidoglycan/xylan/chitin deacetylase (PgdA/CDA1 family)